MKTILNYNFNPSDIIDNKFDQLFRQRRRDSVFSYVYETKDSYIAIRDHLGVIPLYARREKNSWIFSIFIEEIIKDGDHINKTGIQTYLFLGNSKTIPLTKEIKVIPPGTVMEFRKVTGEIKLLYKYEITPLKLGVKNFKCYVKEVEELFLQAMTRIIKEKEVGLYLSGGIDSGLIGVYLKKLGVQIRAYTSAPWGKNSTELPYAISNAKIIGVKKQYIDYLETGNYSKLIDDSSSIYKFPHSTTTALGIISLWKHSLIHKEKQIFLGQNCDTLAGSSLTQTVLYFSNLVPKWLRIRLSKTLHEDHLVDNYLSYVYGRRVNKNEILKHLKCQLHDCSRITQITKLAMYLGNTPSETEAMVKPALLKGQLISNPYYDMDLIEYYMGIPVYYRLSLLPKTLPPLLFKKKVFMTIASNYFPKDVVNRKKGFVVSFSRNNDTKKMLRRFPKRIFHITLANEEQQFAAYMFMQWCKDNKITFKLLLCVT